MIEETLHVNNAHEAKTNASFPKVEHLSETKIETLKNSLPVSHIIEELPRAHPLRFAVEAILAASLLLVLSPFLICVCLILAVINKGQIFYFQKRIGLNDVPFTIFKFKTMNDDAEKKGPMVCTSYEDDRITPLGRFLRRAKIDELPQLVNIILGHMSFVGPRPERPYFHNQYLENIEHWNQRTRVKPGITGLAQISAIITHEPRLKILADIEYIKSRTPVFDLFLIALTLTPKKYLPKEIRGIPIS